MADSVRVGMIGTSWWADELHLPSLQSHPQAEIVAICGRNRERAEEIARKYEISQVFTDYRQMIEQAGLDAVVVVVETEKRGQPAERSAATFAAPVSMAAPPVSR